MATVTKKKIKVQEDHEIRERIVQSRVRLLLKHPFFGNLATRLKLKNADDWIPTAATDGVHLFYNREFITLTSPMNLIFLLGMKYFIVCLIIWKDVKAEILKFGTWPLTM